MSANNQQYCGEIGAFYNKLGFIKCYYESLAYYVVVILQPIRTVNFCILTFSYIFQVLIFQSHISIAVSLNEAVTVKKIQHLNLSLIKVFQLAIGLVIPSHTYFGFLSKIQSLIAYNCMHHLSFRNAFEF